MFRLPLFAIIFCNYHSDQRPARMRITKMPLTLSWLKQHFWEYLTVSWAVAVHPNCRSKRCITYIMCVCVRVCACARARARVCVRVASSPAKPRPFMANFSSLCIYFYFIWHLCINNVLILIKEHIDLLSLLSFLETSKLMIRKIRGEGYKLKM